MKKVIEEGESLIVKGPARVVIVRGSGEVIGAPLSSGDKIIVRDGLSLPFYFYRKSTLDVMLGNNASIHEVSGDVIPESWRKVVDVVIAQKPHLIVVIGDVDCGKTTFCSFLANKLIRTAGSITIVDGDIGQADIGSSATIGSATITSFVTDLFSLKPEKLYFVGVISPSLAVDEVIKGLKEMVMSSSSDFIIVNTDGWVREAQAREYKVSLIQELNPDVVIGLQREEELTSIIEEVRALGVSTFSIATPKTIRGRERKERKAHRELGYKKLLVGAKTRFISLSEVRSTGTLFGIGRGLTVDEIKRLEGLLDRRILYGEEGTGAILLVVRKATPISKEKILRLKRETQKEVVLLKEWSGSFLVGLVNEKKEVSIGVLVNIDDDKTTFEIYTPERGSICDVKFSRLRVSKDGKELMPSVI